MAPQIPLLEPAAGDTNGAGLGGDVLGGAIGDGGADSALAGGNGRSRGRGKAQIKRPNAPDADAMAPIVKEKQEKVGRNEPCWCGSGKKYKFCHGAA